MTELAIPQPKPLRYQELTPDKKALIKGTIAKGASDDEIELFFHVCNRTGLDPFARQIYAIKRRSQEKGQWVERIVFQIGIEGFRLGAQRSHARGGPKYEGPTPIQWCDEKGNWTDLWLSDKPPFAARAGVYVEGFKEPVYAICEYKRLVQTVDGKPNAFWEKGPAFQLGKCVEAAAIRKAFPNELSGFYLQEELYDLPEIKDITPPMTVEAAQKALLSPPGQKPDSPEPTPEKVETPVLPKDMKGPPPEGKATASVPKGEEIAHQERREEVIKHLQKLEIHDFPPKDLTEIEAGLLLAGQKKAVVNKTLDTMAKSRDQKREML